MSLDGNIKALAKLPLFAGFEPEALRLIAFAAQPIKYAAGDVAFRCGEASEGGYLVLSGRVRLEPEHGGEDAKIVGPGVLIGERALLTSTRNPATATAQENTNALKISRHLLRRVLEEFPASAASMQMAVSRELQRFGVEIEKSRHRFRS